MKGIKFILKIFVLLLFVFSGLEAQEKLASVNLKKDNKVSKSSQNVNCKRTNNDMTKCFSCHSKNGWKEMKYVHGPIAMNECRPCHIKPENAKKNNMELVLANKPCLFCHQDSEIKAVHPDEHKKEKSECNECHDPHASNEKYFLR